jgi:hypothetical protein
MRNLMRDHDWRETLQRRRPAERQAVNRDSAAPRLQVYDADVPELVSALAKSEREIDAALEEHRSELVRLVARALVEVAAAEHAARTSGTRHMQRNATGRSFSQRATGAHSPLQRRLRGLVTACKGDDETRNADPPQRGAVWLFCRFVEMSDDEFTKSVNDVQKFVDLTLEARAEAHSFTRGSLLDGDPWAAAAMIDKFQSRKALARQAIWPRGFVPHGRADRDR